MPHYSGIFREMHRYIAFMRHIFLFRRFYKSAHQTCLSQIGITAILEMGSQKPGQSPDVYCFEVPSHVPLAAVFSTFENPDCNWFIQICNGSKQESQDEGIQDPDFIIGALLQSFDPTKRVSTCLVSSTNVPLEMLLPCLKLGTCLIALLDWEWH